MKFISINPVNIEDARQTNKAVEKKVLYKITQLLSVVNGRIVEIAKIGIYLPKNVKSGTEKIYAKFEAIDKEQHALISSYGSAGGCGYDKRQAAVENCLFNDLIVFQGKNEYITDEIVCKALAEYLELENYTIITNYA